MLEVPKDVESYIRKPDICRFRIPNYFVENVGKQDLMLNHMIGNKIRCRIISLTKKKLYGTYMSKLYVKYRGHIIVKYMSHICILNVNKVEDI